MIGILIVYRFTGKVKFFGLNWPKKSAEIAIFVRGVLKASHLLVGLSESENKSHFWGGLKGYGKVNFLDF